MACRSDAAQMARTRPGTLNRGLPSNYECAPSAQISERRAFNFVRLGIVSSGLPWKVSFPPPPGGSLAGAAPLAIPILARPRRNR